MSNMFNRMMLAVVCGLFCCHFVASQPNFAPRFAERDTSIVIQDYNDVLFRCNYWSTPYQDKFSYTLKKGDFSIAFHISSEDDHYEVSGFSSDSIVSRTECNKLTVIPSKSYLFLDNTLAYVFSNIRATDKFQYMDESEAGPTQAGMYRKYTYLSTSYSTENHQMLQAGRESCFFRDVLDFEREVGVPYGSWIKFKQPVIASQKNLPNVFDMTEYDDAPDCYANECDVMGRPLKWTLTDTDITCEFHPDEKNAFIFSVAFDGKPYIRQIIRKDYDNTQLTGLFFLPNGNLSCLTKKTDNETEAYIYDTTTGMLVKKLTVMDQANNGCLEITYATDREYETIGVR